jgi:hypothetical protein
MKYICDSCIVGGHNLIPKEILQEWFEASKEGRIWQVQDPKNPPGAGGYCIFCDRRLSYWEWVVARPTRKCGGIGGAEPIICVNCLMRFMSGKWAKKLFAALNQGRDFKNIVTPSKHLLFYQIARIRNKSVAVEGELVMPNQCVCCATTADSSVIVRNKHSQKYHYSGANVTETTNISMRLPACAMCAHHLTVHEAPLPFLSRFASEKKRTEMREERLLGLLKPSCFSPDGFASVFEMGGDRPDVFVDKLGRASAYSRGIRTTVLSVPFVFAHELVALNPWHAKWH